LNEIYSQGYFKYLYYKADKEGKGIKLTIVVREKGTNSLSVGLSFDTDRSFRMLLGLNLVSLSGYKYQVGNKTVFGRNPQTNFRVELYPSPLFSYFSIESNVFWNRTNAYFDDGTAKTPVDIDNYGANIKGDVHATAWDNTSVGFMTRYMNTTTFPSGGVERKMRNNGGLFVESQLHLADKMVLPWADLKLYYKANNFNDQNEYFFNDSIMFDIGETNSVTIGNTTGKVENYYSFEKMFLLGGAGSLAGWPMESIQAMSFNIAHFKYSARLFTDPNSILQNAYFNLFADGGTLTNAVNIDRDSADIAGDTVLNGWGLGVEGESVLNLHTILNYEYSKENLGRIYFKIGNEF
jgi:hypothetical protein